jgi:hypothetical protein
MRKLMNRRLAVVDVPTEAEFVEAYVKLCGASVGHAREVYRILVDPKATPEFVVEILHRMGRVKP